MRLLRAAGIIGLGLALFAIPLRAGTIGSQAYVPYETVIANLYFLPVAADGPNTVNFSMKYSEDGVPEGVGFQFSSDPFTVANGAMTFQPGVYLDSAFAMNDPMFAIVASGTCCADDFILYGGTYTFSLPASVVPLTWTDPANGAVYYYLPDVSMLISVPAPEPRAWLLLLLAMLPLALLRRWRTAYWAGRLRSQA